MSVCVCGGAKERERESKITNNNRINGILKENQMAMINNRRNVAKCIYSPGCVSVCVVFGSHEIIRQYHFRSIDWLADWITYEFMVFDQLILQFDSIECNSLFNISFVLQSALPH